MTKSYFILFILSFVLSVSVYGQTDLEDSDILKMKIEGTDTLLYYDMGEISITSKKFSSDRERKLYYIYRKHAAKVYPYALEAIAVFKDMQKNTEHLSNRKKKKYIKSLQKRLDDQFKPELKDLTKTQGRILIHMIESELDTPMYFLVKDLRNGVTARYWQSMGKMFGYDLKKGYVRGEDPLMDMIIDDFKLDYKLTTRGD